MEPLYYLHLYEMGFQELKSNNISTSDTRSDKPINVEFRKDNAFRD